MPKTWTAYDVEMGKLMIVPVEVGGAAGIHLERRYEFVDGEGAVLVGVAGGRVVADIEWSSLPQSVQDALTAIDNWTHQQALAQEGM